MMNYNIACKNLGIDGDIEITLELLKRQYKLKALANHPDKNKEANASEKFQDTYESYQYLLKHLKFLESDEEDFEECDEDYFEFNESSQNEENLTGYRWILYSFLKNINSVRSYYL